jgi:hypothetical protein
MPPLIRSTGVTLALLLFMRLFSAGSLMAVEPPAPRRATSPRRSQEASESASAPARASGAPANPEDSAPAAHPAQDSKEQKKPLPKAPQPNTSSSQARQTDRMLWIVPNFAAVSSGVKFHPMTPKEKFWTATEDSFDYSSFAWTGVLAAQDYALDSYPELGTGAAGYGRYYWRGMLDGVSNSYFSEAIVPVLTREDPRYFTMGGGGFFRRLGYALSRVVVTKSDSGRNTFNISEVGGDFASAAVSQAYYPPEERGMVKTSENWGTQLESAALNNIAKEFWPDIRKDLFHQH